MFVAALLAPLGFAVRPTWNPSSPACCVSRPVLLAAGFAAAFALAACLLFVTLSPAAPFHHICRFLGAPRT
jgi:hypothetical protein